MENFTSTNKEETNNQEVSFRGKPIPQVNQFENFTMTSDEDIINKMVKMEESERSNVTLDGIHYGEGGISAVRLSTGDIISIESAIALAENYMLKGYSAGSNIHHERILRSKPTSDDKSDVTPLHRLPQF